VGRHLLAAASAPRPGDLLPQADLAARAAGQVAPSCPLHSSVRAKFARQPQSQQIFRTPFGNGPGIAALPRWLCFLVPAARNTQAQPLADSQHQGEPAASIGFRLEGTILEVLERNPDSNNLEPVAHVRLTGPLLAFVQYGNRLFIARG